MLTQSDHLGEFAICLNRPTGHTLREVLEETGLDLEINFPLYWGGPVSMNSMWMLHSAEWECEHTIPINDQWSLTSHISMFHNLADGDYPQQFRLMMGYCSWTKGQLEAEMRGLPPWNSNHSWLVANEVDPEWAFEQPVEDLWIMATDLCCHQAVDTWL
jgi:putative transcriptional regulator